jgi:hypothetical protein
MMGHKNVGILFKKKGPKPYLNLKFCIFERYMVFFFSSNFDAVFFSFFELIGPRAFRSMSTDFLYFLWFRR